MPIEKRRATKKHIESEEIQFHVVTMKKKIRRIIREFSQETGIPIILEDNMIIAERSQRKISLMELEQALSQVQVEPLEDAVPVVLFHLDEKATLEQAKGYLMEEDDRIFEEVILTYRIQPSRGEIEHRGGVQLPLRYGIGKLEWQLGVQCGNSKGDRFLIRSHSFTPLSEVKMKISESKLYSLFEKSANKWPIHGIAGPLSEAADLFYLSGSRISDFLFDQSFVEKLQTSIGMQSEELVFFPISRHFALFTNERQDKGISEMAHKSTEIAQLATRDRAVAEILGITKEDQTPVGVLGQNVSLSDRFRLGVSPIVKIKWDVTGDALIGGE